MTFIKALCLWMVVLAGVVLAGVVTAAQPARVAFEIRAGSSYLGVSLAEMNADRAKELKLPEVTGAEVLSVMEGTPAYQAGLRANDVVLAYNGENVLGREQLARLVAETPPGRRVNLVCWRAGKKEQIAVTTAAFRPVSDGSTGGGLPMIFDMPSTIMIWRNLVLGIESESISDQMAQAFGVKQGVLIWNVAAGSPAQRAGVRAGDVLTDFCGRPIHSPREVGFAIQQLPANWAKPMTLAVIRDHKAVMLSIALVDGER